MKTSTSLKTICLFLVLAIFISGCASTTLFNTSPSGAVVYVKGQKRGTTPYHYSDSKIAFSSIPITLKKAGYHDLNIILKRNEQPAVGAIIGGLICYIPLLWFMEYNPIHNYKLEKLDSAEQAQAIISDLKNNPISNPDTGLIKQKNIADEDTIHNERFKEKTISNLNNETDSLGNDSTRKFISEFGFGGGPCLSGGILGIDFTFVSSNNWGGNISYKANIFKSKNVPADYYVDGNRVIAPRDYANILSFNLVREFSTSQKSSRFGVEAGPAWVHYSKAEFELNPNYHPDNGSSWWFSTYKYHKSHSGSNTAGLSLRAKMEFLLSPSVGMELAAFTNINNIKPVTGLEFCFIFGDVGD